jgi:hypothetical protein
LFHAAEQSAQFSGNKGKMRQIQITFKQEGKELVACTADFGNRGEASELENKLADASQAAIATALRKLPADLLGEGYGNTEQEAERLAKVDAQPPHSRYGDNLRKPVLGRRIPLHRVG